MTMLTTLSDYIKIRDLIYSSSGIMVRDNRMDSLISKVDDQIRELKMVTPLDYRRYLFCDQSGRAMEELINTIVVGETYFFREYETLELFAEQVLPRVVKLKTDQRNKTISVLSAGCSTGEEPYTMAIILREMLDDFPSWNIHIDGVDISSISLAKAQKGIYTSHALRETPYSYRDNYFSRIEESTYLLDETIQSAVNFSRINLFDKNMVDRLYLYDFVFLRNVMIYFDRESTARVMEYLFDRMKPGAYIFVGMAESVGRMTDLFKMERIGKSFIYQK